MALVLVLLTKPGRATDQKITWMAGWLHQSHIVTIQSVLYSDCKSPLFPGLCCRPKSDTELLLIVTSWELHPHPSSFLWISSPDWLSSIHFESLLTFPPLPHVSAGRWVTEAAWTCTRDKGRRKRWEALRPRRAYTRLHSSPPISSPCSPLGAHNQNTFANEDQRIANSIMSCF